MGGGDDGPAVERGEAEESDVAVEVEREEVSGDVLRVVFWEREVREVAELLWEVKFDSVVSVLFPQRGKAVFSLQDSVWD